MGSLLGRTGRIPRERDGSEAVRDARGLRNAGGEVWVTIKATEIGTYPAWPALGVPMARARLMDRLRDLGKPFTSLLPPFDLDVDPPQGCARSLDRS